MIERRREIKELDRKARNLQNFVEVRARFRDRLVEKARAESTNIGRFNQASRILANDEKIKKDNELITHLQRQQEAIAGKALREINFDQLISATQPESPTPQPVKESETKEAEILVEQSAASTKEWMMPNRKVLKLSPTRHEIVSKIEQGATTMEDLKKITGKNTSYISATISQLNKSLKSNKLLIYNLSEAKQFGAKYVLQWLGTEKAILATERLEKGARIKDAVEDIYTRGIFSIELPNGKKAEITGALNSAILNLINEGVTSRDEIAQRIYGRVDAVTRIRISAGMPKVNEKLSPFNYKIAFPSRSELRRGTPFTYDWEQIVEEKTPEEIVEESETSETLTNYEAAVVVHLLSADETVAEFKEREIPIMDQEKMNFIMENSGITGGTNLRSEEMRLIRENTTRKVKDICDLGTQGEIYDKVAMDPNPSKISVAELMLYLAELENKAPEAFEVILKNLKDIKNMHWTTDRGRVWDVDFVKDGERYKAPTPTPLTRWEKTREPMDVSVTVKPQKEGERPVLEKVSKYEEGETTEEVVVYDTSAEDIASKKPAQPVPEQITEQPVRYKAILQRDSEAPKKMRTIIGAVLSQYPQGPTTGQIAKDYHSIKHSRVLMAAENGYITGPIAKGRGVPRLSPADASVLIYLDQHDESQLNARAIKDLRRMAEDKVKEVQEKINNKTKAANGRR